MDIWHCSIQRLPLDVETHITVPELVYRSDHATVVCIVSNKDKRAAQLTFSADIRDIGTDPGEMKRCSTIGCCRN